MLAFAVFLLLSLLLPSSLSYVQVPSRPYHGITKYTTTNIKNINSLSTKLCCEKKPVDIDETVKKSGLEVGLWKSLTSKDSNVKPQELLKKYGVAYLATSITFAIISYAICYLLVSNGVDVSSLLEKVGIKATSAASNAGTAGIAYAIHKAASPIRFPPTVALTPIVAEWIGKKPNNDTGDAEKGSA